MHGYATIEMGYLKLIELGKWTEDTSTPPTIVDEGNLLP
jgi:hypothetical protein